LKEFAMRLYAPLYECESFLPPDAAIGASVRALFKAPAPAPVFVRSNIRVEAAYLTALDIHAIEQNARALRNAELGRLLSIAATYVVHGLKAAHTAVVDWLERIDFQERDNFFAASANLAELEQRQRHWERTGCARY
jgi:hypothetical protein